MKRVSISILSGVIITMLFLTAPIAFATTDNPSPVAAPEMKTKKAEDPADSSSLSGKVVETMNSGGYTYVCLEKNGKKTWVAVPQMTVTVGQEIAFQPGNEMGPFASKSLGRTFDSIIFSAGPLSSPQAAGGHPTSGHESNGKQPAGSTATKSIKVEKATGPNAYTVAEIFAKRADLNTKPVVVKGQVVKVSEGIMGVNWIHVQDGTGDPNKKTQKLVVTSDDLPSVGDVVTVKGTVAKDKDFGSGYKYDVIIEKAAISK